MTHYQNFQKPLCHPQRAAQRVFHSTRNAYRSTLDCSAGRSSHMAAAHQH